MRTEARLALRRRLLCGVITAILLSFPALADRVECDPEGIIEGPDPVPGRCEDDLEESEQAEPGGGAHRAHNPRTDRPVEVRERSAGSDRDIQFREWLGRGWSRPVWLSSTMADDMDPRVAVDEAETVHVVWWQRGEQDRVLYTRRSPRSGRWTHGFLVTSDARRPSIAVVDRQPWIAYERHTDGSVQIVVARLEPDGHAVGEVVAVVRQAARLDVELQVQDGELQVSWRAGAGRAGLGILTPQGWVAGEFRSR